ETSGTCIFIEGINNMINNNICYDSTVGIFLAAANHCVIVGNSIYGNNLGTGIKLSNSPYNNIVGNFIYIMKWGITLDTDANYNSVSSNVCYGNAYYGLNINDCDFNAINANIFSNNERHGIYINESNNNTINSNTVSNNDSDTGDPQAGIYLNGLCDDNIISNNILMNNNNIGMGTGYGIYILATCDNNIISGNKLSGNDTDYFDGGVGTKLFGDDAVYGAGWNGDLGTATKNAIYITNSSYNTISGNTCENNDSNTATLKLVCLLLITPILT
ncbi:unnamed protein product, partial [marine sediment metagenome]